MAIEVKNLRIKVNVSQQESATTVSDEKKWSQHQMINAMQQVVKNQKER